jgi:hypothetical protein
MIVVRADDGAHGDDGIAAWAVLDDDGLPPTLAQPITKQAGAEIHAAAGSQSCNELDRPLGPSLRRGWKNRNQQQKKCESGSIESPGRSPQ